ncbi:MarR family winged helix-turn-helix transcriptional regulator [Conexibacter sp. CPCC 206217]|uniref:MarR family winged helix-turn-helix transcriptional regulator n=1 Tax=Conexibacter sp. CPCC 206217 TaxID=3064574 RepID=UPI00271C52FE|nr:MarR family transcriptional regulator [Conexibacter sp. CPCC 206217]MDO8209935.1 MarR family transcriptional regulator [Conexibacter sp. CPCC 206217]
MSDRAQAAGDDDRAQRRAGADDAASDPVQLSWSVMRELVLDHDRRHEIAEALGLSFARVRSLKYIAEQPLTLRALADRLQTDPPYATRIVDDLEQLRLVARTADPRDRRAKLVSATAEGKRIAARASELLDVPPAGLRTLAPDDLATLARILSQLAR